ncbi:F-box/FBD/LRR-repeat protein At5g53840-like [Typha angustifolia]|uniref:F-box/FBD/LRR-repeat protein At5g53840-like n=1 Tax=Typha angustifolia TaxID=59011 RepID=UPI003C2AC24A
MEDHLSDLPDSIIVAIISLLSTGDAVRTSALSSRWRNLWTYITRVDLDAANWLLDRFCFRNDQLIFVPNLSEFRVALRQERRDSLLHFVWHFMRRYQSAKVYTFRINLFLCSEHSCYLDQWITTVASARVESLEFNLSADLGYLIKRGVAPYEFPLLFSCSPNRTIVEASAFGFLFFERF